jgi:putative FmdB family regulatory protein
MPIYEYRCSSCGHELEALRRFADPPLLACPACKADTLVKKVSAAGFQLKGSGWYATDFKGSGGKPAAKATDAESKPADTKVGDSKSDGQAQSGAKPDSKSEGAAQPETKAPAATPAPTGPAGGSPATS